MKLFVGVTSLEQPSRTDPKQKYCFGSMRADL